MLVDENTIELVHENGSFATIRESGLQNWIEAGWKPKAEKPKIGRPRKVNDENND